MCEGTREPANFRCWLAGLVFAIPVLSMLLQFAWHGIAYTFNENEIWFASAQGLNLLTHSPTQSFLLTEHAASVGWGVYTHNPWMLPRLACAILYAGGLGNILFQNLIICLFLYAAHALCVARLLRPTSTAALVFLLLLHSDYLGYFRAAFNLGRAWHFPLFFLCVLAVCRPGRWTRLLPFLAFFLLWQFEIAFAVFTTAAALFLLLLEGARDAGVRTRWRAIALYAALGSAVSVGLFVCQLLCWYGIEGLWQDLTSTLHARNNAVRLEAWMLGKVANEPQSFAELVGLYDERFRVWSMPANLWEVLWHGAAVVVAQYGVLPSALCVLGFVYGAVLVLVPRQLEGRGWYFLRLLLVRAEPEARLLAALLWACLPAFALVAVVLRGETYMINLYHYHPMLVFPVSFAAALGTLLVGETLAIVLEHIRIARARLLAWGLVPAVVFAAWLTASWAVFERYRQLDGSVFWTLMEPRFHGKQITMSSGNSYLAILLESLTGSSPIGVADPTFVSPTSSSTEPEYLVHIEHWAWRTGLCSTFRETMESQGHKTVARGRHFVIVELRSAEPPVDRVQAKESPCDCQ